VYYQQLMTDSTSLLLPGRSYLYVGNVTGGLKLIEGIDLSDQIIVDVTQTDLRALRQVISRTQLKSVEHRVIFFKNTESLSELMQNTLLKLLEEPIITLTVVLQTENPNKLLETVRSRTSIIQQPESRSSDESAPSLESYKVEDLYKKDRDVVVGVLKKELTAQRKLLLTGDSSKIELIKKIDSAITKLEHNTNLKLTLDNLYLHLEADSSYSGHSGYSDNNKPIVESGQSNNDIDNHSPEMEK